MAKTNKYTSINFNHIYEKNLSSSKSNSNHNSNNPIKSPSSSSFSSASYSSIFSPHKSHGRMLVLTRPTPTPRPITPQSIISPQPKIRHPQTNHQSPDQTRPEPGSDAISLRPLGRTGSGSAAPSSALSLERDKESFKVVGSPKPNKFVPPHLRPGFNGREERSGPEVIRSREAGQRQQQGFNGSPVRYGEGGRPKSGGGYERMGRAGDSDFVNRPRSSGNRPVSRGW